MLWKCCLQYAAKFGELSSGHRTGKGQFSFQSQRKAIPKNAQTTTIELISHTNKVMLKILQARLQQYMKCEFPDVQARFRKGRGTRDQIANICALHMCQHIQHCKDIKPVSPKENRSWIFTGRADAEAEILIEKARVLEKHLLLFHWLHQSLWLCGSQQTGENS